jgi:hypothetical protein
MGAIRFVSPLLVSFLSLIASAANVTADEFRTPAISAARVDWRAALDQMRSEIGTQSVAVPAFTFSGSRSLPWFDPRSRPALVQLNAVTSTIFTGIGRSPVPVLLPFDTAAFLAAQSSRVSAGLSLLRYQADFRPVDMFDAGPAGYDAVFSLEPGVGDEMPERTFAKPVDVQITGSILTYDVSDSLGGKGEPVNRWPRSFRTCGASSAKATCAMPSRASVFPTSFRSSVWTALRGRGVWRAGKPTPSPNDF